MNGPAIDLLVFIDVICPWCYVGKKRMEKALATMGAVGPIRIAWLPFQLNPDMPKQGIERRIYRMRKFGSLEKSQRLDAQLTEVGAQEGIAFRYDLMLRTPNTFDAHRLIWLSRPMNCGQDGIVEALFRAYFTDGRDIGNAQVLADIASEAGMNREHAVDFFEGEEGAQEVSKQEDAARRAGLSGVPAFVVNGRPLLVGAHPPDVIASALRGVLGLVPGS